jgi:hypothetical protein
MTTGRTAPRRGRTGVGGRGGGGGSLSAAAVGDGWQRVELLIEDMLPPVAYRLHAAVVLSSGGISLGERLGPLQMEVTASMTAIKPECKILLDMRVSPPTHAAKGPLGQGGGEGGGPGAEDGEGEGGGEVYAEYQVSLYDAFPGYCPKP